MQQIHEEKLIVEQKLSIIYIHATAGSHKTLPQTQMHEFRPWVDPIREFTVISHIDRHLAVDQAAAPA
jgi:hypothetical protein